jgi:two-component system, LytTR family, sensor kinase
MLQLNRRFYTAFFLSYLCATIVYAFTLYISIEGNDAWWAFAQTTIKYIWKAAWMIPIIWFIFVRWAEKPLRKRLLVHLVCCPIWLICWLLCFHKTCDILGYNYLTGYGMVWDIFIPFLLYVVQFAILHAYEYHKHLSFQQEREKQLLFTLHEAQLSGLKAQLQPHFLFNSLNSISASVPPESEHTRILIARLADTFRSALHLTKNDFIPLKDEIEFIRACLDLEKERFGDRLAIDYQIDPSVLEAKIPSMLLQPLIENALKHGIAPSVLGGSISLKINKLSNFIHFEIADTGVGVQNTEGVFERGIGLRNTALRLEKLYGETIVLEKNTPQGTRIKFKIPLSKFTVTINH